MAQQPFYYPPPVNGAQYYAAPSAPLPASPIPIVGPQYCNPHPVDLAITRKVMAITDGNFVVSDVNDNIMFKVKAPFFSLHIRRIIIDAAGNPIITLRQKLMTAHQRWQVFRGESEDESNLIFTAKTSSMLQMKTKMDVFLAHNKAQVVCDYSIKGSWFERSCVIYAGESDSIVAQMHKKTSAESLLIGKDKYMVTVYPNIDFAFIIALILILDEANVTYG